MSFLDTQTFLSIPLTVSNASKLCSLLDNAARFPSHGQGLSHLLSRLQDITKLDLTFNQFFPLLLSSIRVLCIIAEQKNFEALKAVEIIEHCFTITPPHLRSSIFSVILKDIISRQLELANNTWKRIIPSVVKVLNTGNSLSEVISSSFSSFITKTTVISHSDQLVILLGPVLSKIVQVAGTTSEQSSLLCSFLLVYISKLVFNNDEDVFDEEFELEQIANAVVRLNSIVIKSSPQQSLQHFSVLMEQQFGCLTEESFWIDQSVLNETVFRLLDSIKTVAPYSVYQNVWEKVFLNT
ncbi:hypothetical protein RCL1_006363 [Eukaryota sp. TZLM3-RCL]